MFDHIHNGIYLGGKSALERADDLREDGVRAVVRLDRAFPLTLPSSHWPPDFSVLYLPIEDGAPVPDGVFSKVTDFMHQHISGGEKVLVHCQMGISRSTTMVLAYLIEHENMSLPEAFQLVRANRSVVWPHMALIQSLVEHYRLPYSLNQMSSEEFLAKLLDEQMR